MARRYVPGDVADADKVRLGNEHDGFGRRRHAHQAEPRKLRERMIPSIWNSFSRLAREWMEAAALEAATQLKRQRK